ncbi:MAG: phage portal protein, partial [Bacteroidetes bacterium]
MKFDLFSLFKKSAPKTYTGDIIRRDLFGNKRISINTFYTVWRSNSDVFSAVRELYEGVASEGFSFVQDDVENTELSKIFDFGNLKEQIIRDLKISGNVYFFLQKGSGTGRITRVSLIDPRTMSVITDEYGNIIRWIQTVKGQTTEFAPDEILHFYDVRDPDSPVFGLSPIEPVFWEVMTDQAAMLRNYAFFDNGAVPAAQYILEEGLSDQEARRAVELIKEQTQGPKNAHKSIVLRGIKE